MSIQYQEGDYVRTSGPSAQTVTHLSNPPTPASFFPKVALLQKTYTNYTNDS